MKNMPNNMDVVKEILNKTEEEIEKMAPVNILVAGKTGVGKSTLINSVFRENLASTGIGQPVTQHLTKITKEGVPISLYDTRGLELNPAVQKEVKKDIANVYNETKGTPDEIQVTYYCINGNSNRIEDLEVDMIQSLSEKMPVILVLTQSIGKPAEEFKAYLEEMNLPVVKILNVLAFPYEISADVTLPAFGLTELIATTLEAIPDDIERAFNNAQHADIARKAKSARSWARRYIAASFGIGFIPIPFSDSAVLVPMQVTLIAHITAIFGISLDKSTIVSIAAAVFGTTGATQAGRSIVANLIKFIPGAGTIAGGAISGTTAAALTSALAMSYIEVLTIITKAEKDGKIGDLSNIEELMREKFDDHLKRRKNVEDISEVDEVSEKEMDTLESKISKSEKKDLRKPNKKQKQIVDKIKDFLNL